MKIVIDVGYENDKANIAAVSFKDWEDEKPFDTKKVLLKNIAAYEPGQFYKRELPCLEEVLNHYDLEKTDIVIVDGFVWLNSEKKKGLGAYLYEVLDKKIPIIGVAKRAFHGENKWCRTIVRGESKNPLYVTSEGIEVNEAAKLIQGMHGEFRIPTMLKLVDQLSREW